MKFQALTPDQKSIMSTNIRQNDMNIEGITDPIVNKQKEKNLAVVLRQVKMCRVWYEWLYQEHILISLICLYSLMTDEAVGRSGNTRRKLSQLRRKGSVKECEERGRIIRRQAGMFR